MDPKAPDIANVAFLESKTLQELLMAVPMIEVGENKHVFEYRSHMPKLYLKDGVSVSVQASTLHYCSPKNNTGPYTHVELGYIEGCEIPAAFMEYGEPDSSIFAFVPMYLIEFFIAAHGGIDAEKTLKNAPKKGPDAWLTNLRS